MKEHSKSVRTMQAPPGLQGAEIHPPHPNTSTIPATSRPARPGASGGASGVECERLGVPPEVIGGHDLLGATCPPDDRPPPLAAPILGTTTSFASPLPGYYAVELAIRRVNRYVLQSAVRHLLLLDADGRLPDELRSGRYAERPAYCLRVPVPGTGGVELRHYPETMTASFGNVIACASVWACPVCSAKITERRRVEIEDAVDTSVYYPVLLTFTLAHAMADDLADLLAVLVEGYRLFFGGKQWVKFQDRFGVVGRVRSLEVTHGEHGWHPHIHVLLLLPDAGHVADMEPVTKRRWAGIVERLGHYASEYHGLDIVAGEDGLVTYVSKLGLEDVESSGWSLSHELVKSPSKMGRQGGRTPLHLLADYMAGDDDAGQLWLEYYWAFKGQKHLVWSRGLRALLGLGQEKTDEELEAEEDHALRVVLGLVSHDDWRLICGNDALPELYGLVAAGDVVAVVDFLQAFGVELRGGE